MCSDACNMSEFGDRIIMYSLPSSNIIYICHVCLLYSNKTLFKSLVHMYIVATHYYALLLITFPFAFLVEQNIYFKEKILTKVTFHLCHFRDEHRHTRFGKGHFYYRFKYLIALFKI